MASQIQKLMYEGFLAEDPVMRSTGNGKYVTNFRIGSTRQYKDGEGKVVKETTWLKVTAWNKLGEIVNEYCAKGSHVIVEGILRVGENGSPTVYELKGEKGGYGASYEITADAVRILKGKDFEDDGKSASHAPADEGTLPY